MLTFEKRKNKTYLCAEDEIWHQHIWELCNSATTTPTYNIGLSFHKIKFRLIERKVQDYYQLQHIHIIVNKKVYSY